MPSATPSSLPADPGPASTTVVVLALMLLLGTQPISTDLYLPSLPSLPREFGVPAATAQLTLSVLVICFGLAQLVLGPVADRIGRRPVLLGGLGLYTAASAMALAARSMDWLIVCRGAQGMAIAACVVGARAMLRDLYSPAQGAHVLARASTWMGAFPILGPLAGGFIETAFGWRGAFAVLTLFGATGLLYIASRLPESLHQRNPQATRPGPLLHAWGEILRHPTFWVYTAVASFTYAGLFSFLAGSSFVLVDVLGLSRREYGFAMAFVACGFLAGSAWCRRLIPQRGLVRSLRLAAGISLGAGLVMAGLSLAGVHHPLALMLPQFVIVAAHGIHQPCAQVGAIAPFPARAGTATALSGFISMVLAFSVGNWIGWSFNGTVYPLTLTIAAFGVLLSIAAGLLVPRFGQPAAARAPGGAT